MAFLPINGAKFNFQVPPSDIPAVMTPEQAVAAGQILGARKLVPIHYGVSGMNTYVEYPSAEAAFLEQAKKRALAVEVLAAGSWLPEE